MEAHKSYARFETGHQAAGDGDDHTDRHYARNAAFVVAVTAGFLAIATFGANEAVKDTITGETQRADTSAQLENNLLKIDVADGNATLLRVLTAQNQRRAAMQAERADARVDRELKPADDRLNAQIHADEADADHANTQHVRYELAAVGLQVGIVIASISIIARRRWLLAVGGAAASAGVVLLAAGLLA